MIKDLAFAAYYVRDVPRARHFYGEVLGLRPGEWFNDDWIEFKVGNTTFALDGTGEGLGIMPGTSTGVVFEVDDIEAMRQRLVDAGVEATEVQDMPSCRVCFASDPEGNRFAIHQRKG
jgi:predicted enzyme related to lactoylglutathione lyase